MKNRKIQLVVCLLLAVLVLAGCGGSSALVGKWTSEEIGTTLEFKSDGTCTSNGEGGGTYAVKNGKLEITAEGQTIAFDYKVSGDTLTLTTEGVDLVFKKQK